MRLATFRIMLLVPASVLVSASSCEERPRPTVGLNPPAKLLQHDPEPPMPAEALASEEVYERSRDAKIEWGRKNAGIIDRACKWFKDAGVTVLECETE